MPDLKQLTTSEALSPYEADSRPAWIFDIAEREMCWANAAGLSLWKAESVAELRQRDFKKDSISAIERLNSLAGSIADGSSRQESWVLYPRDEPVNVLIEHTMVEIEGGRQAMLLQVLQHIDSVTDQQSIRLVEAARHTPVIVCSFDAEGQLTAENPAAVAFRTNLQRRLNASRTLAEHVNDESLAAEIIAKNMNDQTYSGERTELHQSGQVTLSMTARRGRDPITGEPAIFLTEEDITERVKLANQLATLNDQLEARVSARTAEVNQRQAWYKALFDHASDALFIRDIDSFRIVAANPAAAEMFGVSREDMLEGRFDPLAKKRAIDKTRDIDEPALKGGLDRAVQNGSETMEATFYRDNGEPFPAQVTLIPFPDPELNLVRASIIDLSEREQEQQRYRAIFDTAAEAIVINDIENRQGFVDMNTQAEKLFGVKLEDLQSGKYNFYDFSPAVQPDGRDSIVTAPIYTQAAIRDGSSTFEWTFVDIHGKATACEMTITPFPHPTKKLIRSSIIDISERKRAEATRVELESQLAQAQKLEAIGQLTGGVAHDFNNLLAVILGNMELLQDMVTDSTQSNLINTAIEATERGARLTRSMLAFAKRSELSPSQLDLAEAVAALDSWVGSTIADNISVSTHCDENLWPIKADLAGIERTLLNLVINARDAMPEGGNLRIRAENVQLDIVPGNLALKPGQYVTLSVSDDGVGIEPDVIGRVFDPFFSTKQVHQNSGLGLSMVHGFISQSGGAIGVESEPGKGTTFTLYFPVATQEPPEALPTNKESALPAQPLKILLVEDQEPVLDVLAKILRAEGHEVTPAISGDHAIGIFQDRADYDLLITDIDMPGELQGPDLAERILKHNSELPVIFLSGYNVDVNLTANNRKAQRLMKPISRQGLIKAIAYVAA
ncbi:MAG: PAS domain S-box protein [Pseudomonadales bacterium]